MRRLLLVDPKILDPAGSHPARRDGLLALWLALLMLWLATPAAAKSGGMRNVLLLTSFERALPANITVEQIVRSVLHPGPASRIELFIEDVDVSRFPGRRYEQDLHDALRRKYRSRPIDLIITTFSPALNFALRHRAGLFPGVPIVFCAVEERELTRYDLGATVTGVAIQSDIVGGTLTVALRLHPDAREVIYVGGTTPFERFWEAEFRRTTRAYAGRLAFRSLSHLPMDRILTEVAQLSPSAIVFYFALSRDAAGNSFAPRDALVLLAQTSSVPVYGVSDTFLGYGIVGGHATGFEAQGTKAAEAALRILGGEKVENIPIVRDIPNVTVFDWRQLVRWRIPEDRLPPGSVVRFREPSVWVRYRWYIVGGITLCAVEAVLIVGLLIQRGKRRRAERSLVERLGFERLLADLSAAFVNLPAGEVDKAIERGLRCIVEFLGTDRASLAQFSEDSRAFLVGHSWAREGIERARSFVLTEAFPGVTTRLLRREVIKFSRPADLPEDTATDRESYLKLGVKSQVVVPLVVGGSTLGALACTMLRTERIWADELVPRLQLLGEVFGNALMRKRTETALQESEERFRAVADSAPVLIWMSGLSKEGVFFNKRWLEFTGRSLEQELGQGWFDSIHPDDHAALEACESAFRRREPFQTQFRLRRADGEYRWMLDTGAPRFTPAGTFAGYIGSCIDISERRRAEDALRQSEQQYRTIVEDQTELICRFLPDATLTFVNGAYCRYFDRRSEELIGHSFWPLIPEQDREHGKRHLASISRENPVKTVEHRVVMSDGAVRWQQWTDRGIFDEQGGLLEFQSVGRDITERKQAEERLRTSEAVSGGILASLAGHMAILNRVGVIIRVNGAWTRFALENGAAPSAAVAVGASYLDVCRRSAQAGEEAAQAALDGIRSVLAGSREEFMLEYPCHSQSEERWFLMRVTSLKHPEGGAVVSHVNITHRKLVELEAERLRRELAHVTRVTLMGELTASLAHELNQPLTAIVSNAQAGERILAAQPPPLAEVREILEDIVADGQRAGEVIRGMRGLLKKGEFEFAPLDFNEVIGQVVRLAGTDAVIRNVAISLELDSDLPPVRGDRVQLQQVLLNLILNGFEAMGESAGDDRKLLIRTERGDAGTVRVGVRDSGVGIPIDMLDRIFEPFFTTKGGGMGMGLSITRSIIEAHAGKIWAVNNSDRGATVWFTLPVSHQSAP